MCPRRSVPRRARASPQDATTTSPWRLPGWQPTGEEGWCACVCVCVCVCVYVLCVVCVWCVCGVCGVCIYANNDGEKDEIKIIYRVVQFLKKL
jgi:hypothetical protein